MKSETVSAIHDFSLKARELMLKEVDEQLEGIYGLLPNGKFEPADKYHAVNDLEETGETRKRLEQFITDEKAAGISAKDARSKLALEIAFTRLNRMVALKMMETRELIRQSVEKGVDSNGFKRWVVQNDAELEKYEAGDLPQNAIGEGPRQEAYRHYLLWLCAELSKEIKVLFDPDNLHSRIFPRPRALNQLIEMMNAEDLEEAWGPGGEETIGWVYQFFNENEKKDVFDQLYKKKQKIKKEDIPAATELFTPNWIVKWLVQNSLGRHWIQMHPDSRLAEALDYLIPLAGEIPPVSLKKASDIKMLDPACGTMHFGLIAFDIFNEMYREELENAGKQGWPDTPSVNDENEISATIIANNIHGIDIDLRAVQLSALALYIKAKSVNKGAVFTKANLGCADVIKFDSEKLEKFLNELELKDSVYARLLRGIWEELENISIAGSLLRFEVKLASLIEEEKSKFKKEKQPPLPGFAEEQFETDAGREEFWEIIGTQIRQALDHYVKTEIKSGITEFLFAGETQKGFQVLDILSHRYDVVATNPPYLYRRNMNSTLATFLAKQYPRSKRDLYTAFIERCAELLNEHGRLAMITQQSFMFLSSYEKMRSALLKNHTIETMCHVGPRAFKAISGEKVNTTLFVIRKESDVERPENTIGTYFRLVQEPDAESKQNRFEIALAKITTGKNDNVVFRYHQCEFNSVPRTPLAYWIPERVRDLFKNNMPLNNSASPVVGCFTCDNRRFLRFWWEVGIQRITFGARNVEEGLHANKKWFPYMKGGSFQRWYGNQEYIINFSNNGREIRERRLEGGQSYSLPGQDYYFRLGVTWTDLTSNRFSGRISPGGFIFDVSGSSVFPEDIEFFVGVMNSILSHFLLKIINPTVHVQTGDLARLPLPRTTSQSLCTHVKKCIEIAKYFSTIEETTFDFIIPHNWQTGVEDINECSKMLSKIEYQIDKEVYRLYNISDEDRLAIEAELSEKDLDEKDVVNQEASTMLPTEKALAQQWISYSSGIVMSRFEPGIENALGRGNFSAETAERLRSLVDPDGILVMDEGHSADLPTKVLEALTVMLGEQDAENVVKTAIGKNGSPKDLLQTYLERKFFKEHIKQYRKRPVYWLLQSPRKKYGIWVFHEKMSPDTLYRIRDKYVEPKINHLEGQISGLRKDRDDAEGREKRKIEKQISELIDVLDDVHEFEKLLKFISEERGYTPHIDDGVLLNMAPLWELIPSWQKEPKKAWDDLKNGKYDWSYQAMDHWPERVKAKCKTNKSFAIAHGLDN